MEYQVFQEEHTNGHLWWKITYYKYYRYFEGRMMTVPIYPPETIKWVER